MSEEIEDNKFHINSSFDSEKTLNHDTKNFNDDLRNSRLSSASKKSQENVSTYINHSLIDHLSNETEGISPTFFQHDKHQLNNNKQFRTSMEVSTDNENNEDLSASYRRRQEQCI